MDDAPDEERDTKQAANRAVWFYRRCCSLGIPEARASEWTVAFLLGRKAQPLPEEPKEPWE